MTDRQEEQAALHALHLLDAHEERILQSDSRSDAKLESLMAELEEVVGQIALAVPPEPPPPEWRRALLAEVKHRRRANTVSFTKPLRLLASPWLAWAAVVAIGAAAFHFRSESRRVSQDIVALKNDAAAARDEAAALKSQLGATEMKLAEARLDATEQADKVAALSKINALARMEAASLRAVLKRFDEAQAVVVWDSEKQEGKMRFEKMPPVTANKDYQLWVIDKKSGAPVSAGVVKIDARGSARMTFKPVEPVMEVAKFAISIEALGGVPKKSPDGPIVLASP